MSVASTRIVQAIAATLLAIVAVGAAPAPVALAQPAELVLDAETGAVLHERRAGAPRRPASLTKLMTLFLTFEALRDRRLTLDQELVVSRHAATMPASHLGLRQGQRISVRDAIRAAAIRSANDAAVVLAEAIGGTEENFARLMTERARALGMADTAFGTASGLPHPDNTTTARDMARLVRAMLREFPQHYAVFSERSMGWGGGSRRNTNRLLGRVEGVDGVKTGYTRRAGWCLAASALRGGRRVIVIYLGGASRQRRDARVEELLEAGFRSLPDRPEPTAPHWSLRPVPAPNRRDPEAPIGLLTWGRPLDDGAERRDAIEAAEPAVRGEWAVQLGAFLSPDAAEAELDRMSDAYGDSLRGAFRSVDAADRRRSDGGPVRVWRVRYSGFDEAAARAACQTILASGDRCALVPPSGWDASLAYGG